MNQSEYIKEYRYKRRISQPALAKRMGVSVDSVRNWEQGRSRPLKIFMERLIEAEIIEDYIAEKFPGTDCEFITKKIYYYVTKLGKTLTQNPRYQQNQQQRNDNPAESS